MSIPQYKELVLYRLQEMIREQTAYLVEQEHADLPQLRAYQGRIHGIKLAIDIISDEYRKAYG